MRPVPVKKWQKTVHRPRQSSRLLLLEQLEHRLVLSQIQDGWLIVAAAGSDKMHAGLYAIDPNDPDPMHALHPIATGADFHIPDGLYEDPSSGMLYAGDQGFVPNLPGRFSAPPPTPTSTLFDHHVVKLDPNAPSDPKDNTGALVTFDDPIYGENLYGTDGLVYLNGKVYVINQGDGGGNLHLLVNPDDLNNPQSYDPPTHSVLQIDPNTGIQSSVYNDGGHSAPVPRDLNRHKHDAAYPTGSDYSRETDNVDLNKSLDDEDPNGTDNHPDPEYGYGSNVNGITNDPSANEGAPLWMNVLTGIAPVYRSDGTLDPTHVYIADQQGPDDYQTTQGNIHKYGNDETDPDLSGYVWELDLTRPTDPSAAVPLFPTAPTLYRTQDVTVDPSNGNIIALGFAGYDTSGYRYTAAGLQPVIGVYDPVSHQLLNSYTFSSMTDPRPGTDLVQPVPPPQGQINPSYSFYLGVGGGSDAGDIYRFDTSTGMTTPLISSSLGLGDVTAMIVYHSPSSLVNSVNFETGSFDQLATKSDGTPSVMNAAIVNSPALDGQFSLQLSRNSSPAWAEIRQPDNSYYNLPTAYYSFEFQYASQTGEAGVVNFEDSTGQYKGALHLTQDGYLRVYDANGSSLDIGTTMLQPNLTYTISASIGTGPNAPWEVRINGAPEMSGKGNFGTTDNGGLLLGGRDSYTTNYYYDDVSIRSDSLPGTSPVITPAGEQTATEGTSSPIPLGSFSDTTPGANAWQVDVDWGDGSPHTTFPLNNPGDLTMPPHTYAEEGIYTVKLAVSNNANVYASASEVVNVSDHGLALMAQGNFQPTQDIPFNQSLVQFTDPGGPEPVSHYAATIDWGDGTPTTAGVIAVSGGVFTVSGSHTYTQQPSLPVTVTITHELTSVVVVDTATVSAAPSSQINFVNFETGDFSKVISDVGGDIVTPSLGGVDLKTSTALDGMSSLQILRSPDDFNMPVGIANVVMGDQMNSPYNAADIGYSFLFQYGYQSLSPSSNAQISNFRDINGNPKAALQLTPDGHLGFYDGMMHQLGSTGMTQLQPNQPYVIFVDMLMPTSANPNPEWDVRINGNLELTGTDSLGTTNNGSLELGGDSVNTANFYYDDVFINNLDPDPSTSTSVSASPPSPVAGQLVTFTATVTPNGLGTPTGSVTFSDTYNGVNTTLGTTGVNTSGGTTTAAIPIRLVLAGTHTITAQYNGDNTFTASISAPLPVNVQPAALVVQPPANQTASEGTADSVSLGSFSDTTGPGPWTATVTWGDGTSTTLPAPSGPGSLGNYSHIYTEEGTYTVTVSVTNTGNNASASSGFTVNVLEMALTTASVRIGATFAVPYSGAVATFTDPGGAEALDGTHYSATINWGDATAISTGSISVSGGVFTVTGTHTYAAVNSYTVTVSIGHEGWLFALVQSPAAVSNFVPASMVKPTSFWEGLQGQQLIRRFGLTSSNQTLGQWLAATFPNLYGGSNGAPNLSPFTNSQVGSYYQSLYLSSQGTGLDVEILDTALDDFGTSSSLGGTLGQSYGFTVNSYGLGAYFWNIGISGAAFGTPNNTVLDVLHILLAANNNAVGGEPWNGNTLLHDEGLSVFQGINAV